MRAVFLSFLLIIDNLLSIRSSLETLIMLFKPLTSLTIPSLGLFMGIPWVWISITVPAPVNTLPLMGMGINPYQTYAVTRYHHGTISTRSEPFITLLYEIYYG